MRTAPQVSHAPTPWREHTGLAALTVGMVTGPLGLAVGWWLVAISRFWTTRQKVLAALAVPIPLATGVGIVAHTVLNFDIDGGGYLPPWQVALIWIAFLSLFFVPFVLVLYLARAATTRASESGELAPR